MDYQKQFQSVFAGIDLASKPDICTQSVQCRVHNTQHLLADVKPECKIDLAKAVTL